MCLLVTDVRCSLPGANDDDSPHLQLEFKCFLVDQKTGKHIPVSCRLYVEVFYRCFVHHLHSVGIYEYRSCRGCCVKAHSVMYNCTSDGFVVDIFCSHFNDTAFSGSCHSPCKFFTVTLNLVAQWSNVPGH